MVKYDPVLGAFRTIDGGSQNGNTDTIFAGSGLLTRINETGFQTNWSPDFSNTNLSDVLFSVMQRFDNDEFANATAHLDFVRRLDALENGDSGGGGGVDTSILMVAPDYSNARFLTPNTDYVIESNGYLICTIMAGYLVDLLINRCQFINDGFLEMHETYPVAKGDIVRVSYADIPERETILFVPCKTAE